MGRISRSVFLALLFGQFRARLEQRENRIGPSRQPLRVGLAGGETAGGAEVWKARNRSGEEINRILV